MFILLVHLIQTATQVLTLHEKLKPNFVSMYITVNLQQFKYMWNNKNKNRMRPTRNNSPVSEPQTPLPTVFIRSGPLKLLLLKLLTVRPVFVVSDYLW